MFKSVLLEEYMKAPINLLGTKVATLVRKDSPFCEEVKGVAVAIAI